MKTTDMHLYLFVVFGVWACGCEGDGRCARASESDVLLSYFMPVGLSREVDGDGSVTLGCCVGFKGDGVLLEGYSG